MSSVATLDKDGEDLVMKIKSNAGKFIADEIKESSVKHKIIDKSKVVEVSLLNYTVYWTLIFTIEVSQQMSSVAPLKKTIREWPFLPSGLSWPYYWDPLIVNNAKDVISNFLNQLVCVDWKSSSPILWSGSWLTSCSCSGTSSISSYIKGAFIRICSKGSSSIIISLGPLF